MRLAICVIVISLPACTPANDGREIAAAALQDPSSAQFRNVSPRTDAAHNAYTCGEINGKNSSGAYDGFSRFVVDRKLRTVEIEKAGALASADAEIRYNAISFGAHWITRCMYDAEGQLNPVPGF